jgi:hypothetical protein
MTPADRGGVGVFLPHHRLATLLLNYVLNCLLLKLTDIPYIIVYLFVSAFWSTNQGIMPHCVVTNIRFINVFVLYLLRIHFR